MLFCTSTSPFTIPLYNIAPTHYDDLEIVTVDPDPAHTDWEREVLPEEDFVALVFKKKLGGGGGGDDKMILLPLILTDLHEIFQLFYRNAQNELEIDWGGGGGGRSMKPFIAHCLKA